MMKRSRGPFWSHTVSKCERTSSKEQEEGMRNTVHPTKPQNKLHNERSATNETFRIGGSSNTGQVLPNRARHSAGRGQQTNYRGTGHRHVAPSSHDVRSAQYSSGFMGAGNTPPQRVQSAPLVARTATASRGGSRQQPCGNAHFMSKPGLSSMVLRSARPMSGHAGVSQATGSTQPVTISRRMGPSQGDVMLAQQPVRSPMQGYQGTNQFVQPSNRYKTKGTNFARPPTRTPVRAQGPSGQIAQFQDKFGGGLLPNRHLSPSRHPYLVNQTQQHGPSRHFCATPQASRHGTCPPSQVGRPHEVVKSMQPCFTSAEDVGRKWSQGNSHHWHGQQSFRFKVISYNVLADHLLCSNSNLYRSVERWMLEWEYRKRNLLQELLHYQADILCLQEVQEEHFHDWFQPKLEQAGYSGMFKKRTGDKTDGCATFYKTCAFTLVSSRMIEFKKEGIPLMDRDNVAVIVLLRPAMCRAGNTFVSVANTHVLFNKKRGDIKLAQLACLFAELDEISKVPPPRTSSRRGGSGGDAPHVQHSPVILCGDFNSTPLNPLYDFVNKGKLNYHGLSKMALSGQCSHQNFPSNSLLFANVIPWELGITLTCKKRQDAGAVRDVKLSSQKDCVSVASQTAGSESGNTIKTTCEGSEVTQITPNTSQPSDNSDMLALYRSCTSIEHGFQLKSVYQHYFQDGQPEVTTLHDYACCTVDYIHYSAGGRCQRCKHTHGQLELAGKLPLLTEGQINSFGGLPCKMLSSDHLSLGALFVLHV